MKHKLLNEDGERTYAVVFDVGDEAIAGLTGFARDEGLGASRFTAIGAFSRATLAYWDWESKEYQEIPVDEQVEVLMLGGDITLEPDGSPKVHAHVVLGRQDGSTRGGHLLEGVVRPTLEVLLVESPSPLRRRHDDATGLALIDLDRD
ncbi:MAG: PPC domain-containing DNA-binding protein [Longimicrobiales bacterium]